MKRKNRKYAKGDAVDTGDFGSEAANDANLRSGNKSVGYGGGDGDPRTGSTPTSNVTVPQKKPFQVNTGPVQLPNVGFLTMGFNKIAKGMYDKKNLKQARKDDILGGEMLTTGQKKVTVPDRDSGGQQPQLCPDGSLPPCKTPNTQIKAPAPKNMFLADFRSYDDGGEIVISSNVDKSLL